MLIYVLRWQPSWISDRHKKTNFIEDLPMIIPGQLVSIVQVVSEKKIFEISANRSILLALAAMLNIRLERKTENL